MYFRRWSDLNRVGFKNPHLRQLQAFDGSGDPDSEEGEGGYNRRLASSSKSGP